MIELKSISNKLAYTLEPDYVEIIYSYNFYGDIEKIDELNYLYEKDTNNKFLKNEIINNFEYNLNDTNIVTINVMKREPQFEMKDGNLTENGYKTEKKRSITGLKENIRVGKDNYEEIIVSIVGLSNITRSEAEIVNSNHLEYQEYIMYPLNMTFYKDSIKEKEYLYTYKDNNYLYGYSEMIENNEKQYFYKYLNNKMGKFEGSAINNYLTEEFTFKNNQITMKENLMYTRLAEGKLSLEDLGKEYDSKLDVPVTSDDFHLETFDGNSYYMYVYLEDGKRDFIDDLQLIGGVWPVGLENNKYTLYVKFDVYEKVYNKIKNIDGVKDIEKTTKIFKMEDFNKIETSSDNKYLMQIFTKDTNFLNREFYTFCSNYR